jgi:mRNA deadenylase 3'-5' endonuclease subunit Ccr4
MNTESFEDTLDYIFFANFKPSKVETKKLNQDPVWYPNAGNPSDHLPLQTTIYF